MTKDCESQEKIYVLIAPSVRMGGLVLRNWSKQSVWSALILNVISQFLWKQPVHFSYTIDFIHADFETKTQWSWARAIFSANYKSGFDLIELNNFIYNHRQIKVRDLRNKTHEFLFIIQGRIGTRVKISMPGTEIGLCCKIFLSLRTNLFVLTLLHHSQAVISQITSCMVAASGQNQGLSKIQWDIWKYRRTRGSLMSQSLQT